MHIVLSRQQDARSLVRIDLHGCSEISLQCRIQRPSWYRVSLKTLANVKSLVTIPDDAVTQHATMASSLSFRMMPFDDNERTDARDATWLLQDFE